MDFTSKDKVLRLLEQAAASLDGSTGEDLGPAFKRYRQAVFKLNYKINKLNAAKRGAAKVCNLVLQQRPESGSRWRHLAADSSVGCAATMLCVGGARRTCACTLLQLRTARLLL
jgi:hypothetical protein